MERIDRRVLSLVAQMAVQQPVRQWGQRRVRIPIEATAHVLIKQAGYISASSAFQARTHLRSAAGPYIRAKAVFSCDRLCARPPISEKITPSCFGQAARSRSVNASASHNAQFAPGIRPNGPVSA